MSISQTNMAMKHRENSYLRILYQYESIIIISMSNISNKIYQWSTKKITVSKSPIKIIDQYNQSCQCPKWKLGNPQCAIKKWVSTNRLIKSHICFTLSSSLTLSYPQRSRHFVDPAFRLNAFPTRWRNSILVLKWFYLLKRVDLESPLIFVLFLKG